MADYIKEHIGTTYKEAKISYYENTIYLETNNVVPLYQTADFCNDDMLMLEYDIYYHKEMLVHLLDGKGECSILVSPFNPVTMDGSVITTIDGGIAQGLFLEKWQDEGFDYSNVRKTVNMYKFTKNVERKYMPLIKSYVENMGENSYYEKSHECGIMLRYTFISCIHTWNCICEQNPFHRLKTDQEKKKGTYYKVLFQ